MSQKMLNDNVSKNIQQSKITPLISVVVPIYRVEKYINRCINSIQEQEYKNLQIILVDDGSPDKCPAICDDYAQQDRRITVIHKSNGGLSDARNTGIEASKGEYIAFVDSDDYVDKKYISHLYRLIKKYSADISVCKYSKVLEGSHKYRMNPETNETLLTNIEAMKDLFTYKEYSPVQAWNKLYKASIFFDNMIRYPKGKIHEDTITTFKLFHCATKIVYSDQRLYYYLIRPDSITGRRQSIVDWYTKKDFINEMNLIIREHNLPLNKEINAYYLMVNLHYIGLLSNTGNINRTDWDELKASVVSEFPKCLISKRLSLRKKVAIIVVCLGWKPYLLVSKLLRFVSYPKEQETRKRKYQKSNDLLLPLT